ncbi:hypothetical protein [Lederbergia lenta]|nr:hypothetical protein [Lederbergia lenta]
MEKKNNDENFITNEVINEYLKRDTYHDQNGVVHTTSKKYFIKE